MSTEFADFADAMARPARPADVPARAFGRVAVLGGGTDARLLAAVALSEGAEVTLFSAYGAELSALRSAGGIALRGAGPIGSYQIDSDAAPSVKTTAELDAAVAGAELIFLTGPVHKQRTYAMVLADHLSDGQVLVLAPARTMGALEARWLLKIGGCTADVTLVEAAALPFWADAGSATLTLSAAAPAPVATLPAGRTDVVEGLRPFLPNLVLALSVMHSGFADASGLIEVATLALGGPALAPGGPTIPMGGQPLAENQTFRNLIGEDHLAVIRAMAEERRETARRFGVRDLPDCDAWLDMFAGAPSGAGARPVPDRAHATALIRCAVTGSLVPMTSAARIAQVATPATDGMIALASALLGADLATAGRTLGAVGIGGDIDTARRALEEAV